MWFWTLESLTYLCWENYSERLLSPSKGSHKIGTPISIHDCKPSIFYSQRHVPLCWNFMWFLKCSCQLFYCWVILSHALFLINSSALSVFWNTQGSVCISNISFHFVATIVRKYTSICKSWLDPENCSGLDKIWIP